MANRPASHYPDIGVLGEDLVAQWLLSTGWSILQRRWRCRWGEIDLVARLDPHYKAAGEQGGLGVPGSEGTGDRGERGAGEKQSTLHSSPILAFVEVKTRSQGNWDAGGLLSITAQKQAKLWQTAQCFLTTFPDLADYPCRFDVALVRCHKLSRKQSSQPPTAPATIEAAPGLSSLPVHLGQVIIVAGYQLVLQEYLASAFD